MKRIRRYVLVSGASGQELVSYRREVDLVDELVVRGIARLSDVKRVAPGDVPSVKAQLKRERVAAFRHAMKVSSSS